MFEYSNRVTRKFEQFLREKNLFDDNDLNFGFIENTMHLYNSFFENDIKSKPFIIFSFIPRYLEDNRVDVVSKDLENWIIDNSKGYDPAPHVEIINQWNKIVTLYGITYPNIVHNFKDDSGNDYYWNYCELLNNGYMENGYSYSLFYVAENEKVILNLTHTVAYFWMILNFAVSYYKKIKYFEDIIFQLSAVNVKGIALGGFGIPEENKQWPAPYSWDFEKPPVCRHEKFKFHESFSIKEIDDIYIKNIVHSFSKKISRAFGETKDKCFDENGNIHKQKLVYLQR